MGDTNVTGKFCFKSSDVIKTAQKVRSVTLKSTEWLAREQWLDVVVGVNSSINKYKIYEGTYF